MKKLLITTMAAASLAFYAKAGSEDIDAKINDNGFISGTSFESLTAGNALDHTKDDAGDSTDFYWSTDPADGIFQISKLTSFASTYPTSRPAAWADESNNNNALFIDSDKPLMRNVYGEDPQGNHPAYQLQNEGVDRNLFFDSVVQFTATDMAPTPDTTAGDKLIAWLYYSEDATTDNVGMFGETEPLKRLVITAALLDGTSYLPIAGEVKHYLVDVTEDLPVIEPDSWHRLTIKAVADIEVKSGVKVPGFQVYVDDKLVTAKATGDTESSNKFPSLVGYDKTAAYSVTGVAFDGKGAVDDLVFTTTDPFYEEPEVTTYAIACTASTSVSVGFSIDEGGEYEIPDLSKIGVATNTVYAYVMLNSQTETLNSVTFNGTALGIPTSDDIGEGYVGYNFLLPIGTPVAGSTYELVISTTTSSTEEAAQPTVNGAEAKDADDFKAAAKSGSTITLPENWKLENGVITDADGKTYATFESYYTATPGEDGTFTVAFNDTVKPEVDESAEGAGDAIAVTTDKVTLGITNAKKDLYYTVKAYSDVACTKALGAGDNVQADEDGVLSISITKPAEVDAAFFKVMVDDKPFATTEAQ